MPVPQRLLPAVALTCALALSPGLSPAGSGYAVYESQAPFEDVLDALKLAIEERGMYINNLMHLSQMLERTGKDLGDERPIYGRAESIEFCSAVLSREMTREDPARLVNCPFIVSVYTLPDRTGTTFVAHREIPQDQVAGNAAMAKVAAMLKDVAGAAASW
jgi:uncharacterized protein (DUF302 family)